MVAENILLQHWESELTTLKENMYSYTTSDTEMTHKIRVGIKKLRAYFKLYFFIYKKEETKELFKDTVDLFSLLGKHRNIQINKEKVEAYLHAEHQPYLDVVQPRTERHDHGALRVSGDITRYPVHVAYRTWDFQSGCICRVGGS